MNLLGKIISVIIGALIVAIIVGGLAWLAVTIWEGVLS